MRSARRAFRHGGFLRLFPPQPMGRGVRAQHRRGHGERGGGDPAPAFRGLVRRRRHLCSSPMKSAIGCVNSILIGGPLFAKANSPRRLVGKRFGPAAHVKRLRESDRPPASRSPGASIARGRRHILFFTSNGVGIGHLTRMLAVARRCPTPLQPVFLTLSQAVRIVREQGFLVEYLPFHASLGCDIQLWNKSLREELNELIGILRPAGSPVRRPRPVSRADRFVGRQPGSAVGLVPARHVATGSRQGCHRPRAAFRCGRGARRSGGRFRSWAHRAKPLAHG